ncbi:hypothetical protein EYF80_035071 [Liparis tanakae]|uniref:Secreted protein n=1 Tax=Liparis tanakae TaxID=230148 RepID=A0A4Z2GM78_9TELE|nr:hypothetical protein EYF80_035071 [Liparis tanakae]
MPWNKSVSPVLCALPFVNAVFLEFNSRRPCVLQPVSVDGNGVYVPVLVEGDGLLQRFRVVTRGLCVTGTPKEAKHLPSTMSSGASSLWQRQPLDSSRDTAARLSTILHTEERRHHRSSRLNRGKLQTDKKTTRERFSTSDEEQNTAGSSKLRLIQRGDYINGRRMYS